jgi:hypothetical protein
LERHPFGIITIFNHANPKDSFGRASLWDNQTFSYLYPDSGAQWA